MISPDFLRQRFAAGLTRRVPELFTLIDALASDPAAVEPLMRAFHSLAGIGGTYGFPEVTALARPAEIRCDALLHNGQPADASDVREFRSIASRLAALLTELRSDAPLPTTPPQ